MSDTELENILLTFANRVLDVRNGSDNPTLGELVDTPTQAILSLIEAEKALVLEEVLGKLPKKLPKSSNEFNPSYIAGRNRAITEVTQIIKGVK